MTDTSAPAPTLYADFVAALGELDAVPKGRTARVKMKEGGEYSYDYADLADVLAAVRPVLASHHLAVVQDVVSHPGEVHLTTLILHASGEQFSFGPLVLPGSTNPQTLGSAITYARRYSLLAALGIATEDDDGAAAARPAAERPERHDGPQRPPRAASVPRRTSEAPAPRTDAEGSIRTILGGLSAVEQATLRARFVSQFSSNLAGLDPSRHADALAWVEAQLADVLAESAAADAFAAANDPDEEPDEPDSPEDAEPGYDG